MYGNFRTNQTRTWDTQELAALCKKSSRGRKMESLSFLFGILYNVRPHSTKSCHVQSESLTGDWVWQKKSTDPRAKFGEECLFHCIYLFGRP